MVEASPVKSRLVIADDSPDYLRLLALMLEPLAGVEVVATAANGTEAVRLVREEQIDVALLDVDMPGLDGFAAAAAIRHIAPRTTVLLQTGQLAEGVRRRAAERGFFVFEKLDLVKNLERLVRSSADQKAA